MTALLSYFFIALSGTVAENISVSDILTITTLSKTLTPDDKYSIRNSSNLPKPIQIQLSKILKDFYEYFTQFLESASNFKHFEIKDDPM